MPAFNRVIGRRRRSAQAVTTSLGQAPEFDDSHCHGSGFSPDKHASITNMEYGVWGRELKPHHEYFARLKGRLPSAVVPARVAGGAPRILRVLREMGFRPDHTFER